MLPSISSLSPPPPPPPPEALVAKTLEAPPQQQHSTAADGLNPSLLIISAIILFVAAASASIHLLLRYLSRQSQPPSPLILHRLSSSSSSSAASPSPSIAGNQKALIDSLPLFSLASSLARLPKSSPDCAVCLSRFEPHDQLRLLPSCRHAFHSTCIDTWLRSSRSCPLCRDPISLNPPHPQSAPVPATASDRSGSFRLEIGSVSRRRTTEEMEAVPVPNPNPSLPPHARSYSLGSSFDYVVEEEVEAVVAAVAAHVRRVSEMAKDDKDVMAPGEEVAEAAGGGRGWLKDYVDRLASSASSSFSSLRCSGRFSRRSDAGGGGGVGSWDLEGNPYRMEEDGVYSFYRWLTGA